MAAAVSAIVGRTSEVDEVTARITDARRERVLEAAKASADQTLSTAQRPIEVKAETARAVEGAQASMQLAQARRSVSDVSRPNLSVEVRSMLATPEVATPPARSTQIIGQLIDALRAYENAPR